MFRFRKLRAGQPNGGCESPVQDLGDLNPIRPRFLRKSFVVGRFGSVFVTAGSYG